MANAPSTTSTPTPATQPAAPPVLSFEWSFKYDGPVEKIDDRSCILCSSAAAKKCLLSPSQHPGGVCGGPKRCTSAYAAECGHCHNHFGVLNALEYHPKEHVISGAHSPTFEAVKQSIADTMEALPKDTKNVWVKSDANMNPELTRLIIRTEIIATR